MERTEIALLLRKIDIYYDGKVKKADPKERFESWASVLADIDGELVNQNLMRHVKTNSFPPTLADLIQQPEKEGRAIPTFEQTQRYLKEKDDIQPASDETREKYLAQMRDILGIQGGGVK